MNFPEEYSFAVWVFRGGKELLAHEGCIGYCRRLLDTREKVAEFAITRALNLGCVTPGERYEVDVSEDASDHWETVLTGVVERP